MQRSQTQAELGDDEQPVGKLAQDGGVVGSRQTVCRQPPGPPSSVHGLKQQFAWQSDGIGTHCSAIAVQGGGFW